MESDTIGGPIYDDVVIAHEMVSEIIKLVRKKAHG
jgi:hypothetical protein